MAIFADKNIFLRGDYMKYTSAQAAKLLRKLNDEYYSLKELERNSKEFVAALCEDVESVRPEYDFEKTQKKLDELESKIRSLKHAINVFNTVTKVDGFDMTIDQMLVFIPQLSSRKEKLSEMKSCLPKTREPSNARSGNIIDYRFANYDIKAAEEAYREAEDILSHAQTALDVVNNTITFDIDI